MITVIGLGFVGLTTSLGFSHKGYTVYGFDTNQEKMKSLRQHEIPFFEPGLYEALKEHKDKLFFLPDTLSEAIDNSKIIFLCVGTPSDKTGLADLSQLLNAIHDILKQIKKGQYKVIVIKSTIPPSTTNEVIKPYIESLGFEVGKDIGLSNNPEFLREGTSWMDFLCPDRVLIGTDDDEVFSVLRELYEPFGAPIYKVSYNTAEFIKYLSNTLLSTLISFSNEMSMIAHTYGDIDISKSFKILSQDRRWFGTPAAMTSYVYPGCGFGGYCLPKDTLALYAAAKSKGYEASLLKTVLEINDHIKHFLADRFSKEINTSNRVGILGLSFKPGTTDVRDTPAASLIEHLIRKGYTQITVFDPMAMEEFRKTFNPDVEYADNIEDVLSKCDCVIIVTWWKEFEAKKEILLHKKVYDFRYATEL
ncbi:MAG: UDP-glucose/GDP-mannose dehydrogenase family protein [Nitrospirae bacterium]|nr:UDP-glucose/GDP-mannose dehydrogenase family protein [Nitrospirota bacterium]